MSFWDIVNNLIPSEKNPDYVKMYTTALEYLNMIKLSRFKALYFGSMQSGVNWCSWNDDSEFDMKYAACSVYILRDLYEKSKDNIEQLTELSLSMLYSMLSLYMTYKDIKVNKYIQTLIDENDKFVNDDELKSEFEGD